LREDGKLGKFDGFHRLAVAFAAQALVIPFWAVLPDSLAGVRMIDEADVLRSSSFVSGRA
jgi:hypothetical protein